MGELNRISRHAPTWLRDIEEYIEIWKLVDLSTDAMENEIKSHIEEFWVYFATDERAKTLRECVWLTSYTEQLKKGDNAYLSCCKQKYHIQ